MKTGNLTGSVREDADCELELSHESAVLVTGGLPSLAKFVANGFGNADSDASLVIFRFAHGTNVERQDGVLLVDVSQKVTSVSGLEGVPKKTNHVFLYIFFTILEEQKIVYFQ